MKINQNAISGLTQKEAEALQQKYGKNELTSKKKETIFDKALDVIKEPMFLLLLGAAIIYFILGEPRDGLIMLVFVVGIISIEIIQEWKTDKTLQALKDLSTPTITVIRDGEEKVIRSVDLVTNDVMLIQEGVKIPADGFVLKANDLCVDESSLTGESIGVNKVVCTDTDNQTSEYFRLDYCYAGTLVTQGSAFILVDKIGKESEYGKIGENVTQVETELTPLQKQTGKLVRLCACIAGILFILVACITYMNLNGMEFTSRVIESILSGITLAMAMIPEEFPVILTVFLSMGAWRLARKKSLVRRLPSVETLGAVSVLCVDKTGTITMNQMTVEETYTYKNNSDLIYTMGLACETDAYDPMEKAMLSYAEKQGISSSDLFSKRLVKEYSFTNELKMMGHIWEEDNHIVIACKGSIERILDICVLTRAEKEDILLEVQRQASNGLRVIGVGRQVVSTESEVPESILDCKLTFCGLIGLTDPPREGIQKDIQHCYKAGIRVVMITGDNGVTASSIAKKIGMRDVDHVITGDMLNQMSDEELKEKVKDVSIFSRVIPEHKMRIVKAFKENGEVVAMTGDGVNDAPALKYADIGIAMGKRGSEVSKEAADLILLDDRFSTIVDTIQDGRRIYDNIQKAVGYVFVIHIPIAFASLLAPFLNIPSVGLLLLPLHVVLLELVIDPTCSIVLERQPAEEDIMTRKPRDPNGKLLPAKTLFKSIIQGLVIFASSFGVYYSLYLSNPSQPEIARSMGLMIILFSNLFLVQVNSSRSEFVGKTILKLMKDKVMWGVNVVTVLGALAILYSPLNTFLKLYPLSLSYLFTAIGLAFVSVMWYEIVKWMIRIKEKNEKYS